MHRALQGRRQRRRHTTARSVRGGDSVAAIATDVVACTRCPRLRRYCAAVARTKRRAYLEHDYWGRPVPAFGSPGARLWILGLAPAAHGANRTGRMFTGDSSGNWLFEALHGAGFARLPTSQSRDDGQELRDAYISAVVRCAPPQNKPKPDEIKRCASFLAREIDSLTSLRILLCLGQIAFAAALRLLQEQGYAVPRPRPRFAHAAEYTLRRQGDHSSHELVLLASYHPSRQNTQTRRLTRPMWDAVFERAQDLLAPPR